MGVSVKIDTSGMDRIRRNMQKLSGEHSVSFTELFPDTFMSSYTGFSNLKAMFDAGGIEDPEEIKSDAFSQFVAENSQFSSWDEMFRTAGVEYAKRTLHS
jgi:hypothetical protein